MDIFTNALTEWLGNGAKVRAYEAQPFTRDPSKIWPSRAHACPKAHAMERAGRVPTIPLPDTVSRQYRMALGLHTGWRWYNILRDAGLDVRTEVQFSDDAVAGHLDILLTEHGTPVPIEIKLTDLRFAYRHFLQTVFYARSFGQAYLLLDRGDGSIVPLEVRRDGAGIWRAYSLQTDDEFTYRGAGRSVSDTEIDVIIARHQVAAQDPDSMAYRLPDPTTTQCVRQNGETMCSYWCWSEPRPFFHIQNHRIVGPGLDRPLIVADW